MHKVWTKDLLEQQEEDILFDNVLDARKHTACLVRSSRRAGMKVIRIKSGAYAIYPKNTGMMAGFVSMEQA